MLLCSFFNKFQTCDQITKSTHLPHKKIVEVKLKSEKTDWQC